MKFSSEPPTAALFFVGTSRRLAMNISSEIKNFDRDFKFRARSIVFDRWALRDVELHRNQVGTSWMSGGTGPQTVPGTLLRHSDHQIPLPPDAPGLHALSNYFGMNSVSSPCEICHPHG